MSDSNQDRISQPSQTDPEGTAAGDPNLSEAAVDKVMVRLEGQNENITTPPKEVQADIAATARDVEESMLEIEDAS
jgi:hypothetical protein